MKFATFSLVAILIISAAQILDCKNGKSFVNTPSNDADDSLTKDLLKTMKDLSDEASQSIRNSMRRDASRNIFSIAKEARSQLPKVGDKAKSLIVLAERKLTDAKEEIDASINEEKDELAAWCDEEAQKGADASDEKKSEIHLLIKDLLESFDDSSRSCADKTLQPIRKLQEQTQKSVKSSFPLMKSFNTKLDNCARLNQKNKRSTSKCAKEAKQKLRPILAFIGKYSKLFNQVKGVRVQKYKRSPCAMNFVDELDTLKSDVSKNIDNILHDSKESRETESPDSGSPDSTEPLDLDPDVETFTVESAETIDINDPIEEITVAPETTKGTTKAAAGRLRPGVNMEMSELNYKKLKISYN